METDKQPVESPAKSKANKRLSTKLVLSVLVIILLLGGGAGAYYQRDRMAKNDHNKQQAQIDQLSKTNSALAAQIIELNKAAKETTTPATKIAPSAAVKENIKASITSGNTAALESYMAASVTVIIAASEGIGTRTAAQAVNDVTSYLTDATSPWNFALANATLTQWGSGDYAQYFPGGAVVGKSANNKVVSFAFNNAGKISVVFMAASDSLL